MYKTVGQAFESFLSLRYIYQLSTDRIVHRLLHSPPHRLTLQNSIRVPKLLRLPGSTLSLIPSPLYS